MDGPNGALEEDGGDVGDFSGPYVNRGTCGGVVVQSEVAAQDSRARSALEFAQGAHHVHARRRPTGEGGQVRQSVDGRSRSPV